MIFCDELPLSEEESDDEESELELEEELSEAGDSFTTTANSTSVIGAPKSIDPVENASIYLALISSSLANVAAEEPDDELPELASSSITIS